MSVDPVAALAEARDNIARSARVARRGDGADIGLIAVTKTRSSAEIAPLLAAGHRLFGENRVQEAQEKWPALKARHPDVALHMIGRLQSNKAADAVALFDCIHSLDRPSLLAALGKAMQAQDRFLPCFIQVDIGEEPQKGGVAIAGLPDLLSQARDAGIAVVGLMAVPPLGVEPAPYFALLAKLARDHGLARLSMGMSEDYETAVMLGATEVRIGSALFGPRSP